MDKLKMLKSYICYRLSVVKVLVEAGNDEFVECEVSSASSTQIVCSIHPRCEGMPIGMSLSLIVSRRFI